MTALVYFVYNNTQNTNTTVSVPTGAYRIVAISPLGYAFSNWTVTTGSGTIVNSTQAQTSLIMTGTVTVTANFLFTPPPPL